MTKYKILIKILDAIIQEAPANMTQRYYRKADNLEYLNQSRAKAFIHLYLKVTFGLLNFNEREHFITDGSHDGGVDGYYINPDNKTIYFIQSKFRTNDTNFENKQIDLSEILAMDINRILDGEEYDENQNLYNGKIKQLQREISSIDDIARYSYQVVLLANLKGVSLSSLRKLTEGFACTVFDHEKCYNDLVFPVISGTYYSASDLSINIDLSNKNAGSKISYTVTTKKGECEITVLFVPAIELGRIMLKYKNSILKYNPRSYLGHEGKKVNNSIKSTIIDNATNEFALFNNGVTLLSDETYINEKIGQKNKAQLIVKNPQIINGGQTSYTLSRIYEKHSGNDVETIFQSKEVLIKIITLIENTDHYSKIELIKEISNATNQQTPVINADKFANDNLQISIQKLLFDSHGILYERKRGEFADGVYNDYISEKSILERNLFYRMYFSSNGHVAKARQKKLFMKQEIEYDDLLAGEALNNTYFGYLCFMKIRKLKNPKQKVDLRTYAKVRAMTILYKPDKINDYEDAVKSNYQGK